MEQYKNAFPAYGGGIEGYGKRYAAALANHLSGTMLGRAVYPSIFHQDPRYFYKGKGSVGSRTLYAISTAVIARGGGGSSVPKLFARTRPLLSRSHFKSLLSGFRPRSFASTL